MDKIAGDWLLLTYRLPAEPSRKRVAVWRHLRKLGAVYLEVGVWLLPHTEALAQAIQGVIAEVQREGGIATVFLVRALSSEQEEELRTRFNQAREKEYAEVRRECQKLLAHIQREAEEQEYEFAEVEELEEDFEKIERWFSQVHERDIFGIEAGNTVEQQLRGCREALARFTQETYERRAEYPGPG